MDRNSVIRGFKEVFGVDNEEIAVRFYKLFVMSDAELIFRTTPRRPELDQTAWKREESLLEPPLYQVDILRFYHIT